MYPVEEDRSNMNMEKSLEQLLVVSLILDARCAGYCSCMDDLAIDWIVGHRDLPRIIYARSLCILDRTPCYCALRTSRNEPLIPLRSEYRRAKNF
jgi:hypothetical protein